MSQRRRTEHGQHRAEDEREIDRLAKINERCRDDGGYGDRGVRVEVVVDNRPSPWTGYDAGQDPTPRLLLLAGGAPRTRRAQQRVLEASIREQRAGTQAD